MKILILILLSLTLFGCTHNQGSNQSTNKTENSSINSAQRLVELKFNVSNDIRQKMQQPRTIVFDLGVIPGNLYGSPLHEPRWYTDLYFDSKPTLNLTEIENNLSRHAKNYISNSITKNLKIKPSATKFLRASTFGIDRIAEEFLSGGLKDDNGNFLLLVYFDRACTIKGDVDFDSEGVFKHNINIPNAGLYALVIDKSNNVTAKKSLQSLTISLKSINTVELTEKSVDIY